MKLILVRHGETHGNIGEILADDDDELTSKGVMQAKAVAGLLKSEKVDVILSSPLLRAKNTASAIAKFHPGADFIEVDDLRERGLGSYVNKRFDEVNWQKLPSDVESRPAIDKRAQGFVERTLQNYASDTVVVVTHNAVIRAIVRFLMKGKRKDYGDFRNCSVTIFEVSGKEVKEILFNSTRHLK
jgi:broad specificity phosphatase PhoE